MRAAAAAICVIVLVLAGPASAAVDCGAEATKLARGSCVALRGMFFQSVGGAASYGDAKECSVLTAGLDGMLKGAVIPDGCCRDARVFVTSGCACSPDVPDLLTSLRVLPAGADASLSVSGIVNLLQASKCATTAQGGPILNTCVGSTGCGASA